MHLACGLRKIDARFGLVDFCRIGDSRIRLRPAIERAALQRAERTRHQAGAALRQDVVQLPRRHVGPDGDGLGETHRSGVETLLHAHDVCRRLVVPRHDRPLNGRGAAPAGQCRGVQVEAAEPRRGEDSGGQQEPIRNDDGGVGMKRGEVALRVLALEALGRAHFKSGAFGKAMDRRLAFHHAAPRRPRGLGVDGRDLVTGAQNLRERRHGELRRAHEDDAQGHRCVRLRDRSDRRQSASAVRACFLNLRTTMSRFRAERKSIISLPSR